MRRFRRPFLVLLALPWLWPSLVLGQGERAGVVTTLQGTVTTTRSTAPQPVALKFKDDVYLQDRVTTGDQSIARILLGGKALITVRERSVLTITEIPGRATVALESGKIGVAVAREKMRPGESLDIRTSNAIAAVRGTVVVAEVLRATAQGAPGTAPQVTSNFYVLRDATNRGVQVTQLATGAIANLLPGQGFSILGATAGRNVPIPANVNAGLSTQPGAQHVAASPQATSNVAAIQTQQAVLLTEAVLGAPSQITAGPAPAIPPALPKPIEQTEPQFKNSAEAGSEKNDEPGGEASLENVTEVPPPDVPDVDISGTITLGPGEVLHRFSTSTTRSGSAPVVRIHGSVTAEEMLIQVDPGVVVSLASPLLDVIDSTLVTQSAVLGVQGSISSSSPAPFLSFDPTTVTAANVISVAGGTLSVAGPLIQAIDTTFVLSNSVMSLVDGAAVTKTGSTAAIQLLGTGPNGTTVTAGGNVISLATTTPVAIRPTLTLAGPLLETVNAQVVGGGGVGPKALLFIGDGAVLTKTDETPLLRFTDSTIPNPGPILSLRRSPSLGAFSTLDLLGAVLLEATGSALGSVSVAPLGSGACCSGFFVGQGAQLLATGSAPLIRLTGSTFNAGVSGTPGGNFFAMLDDCPGCGDPLLAPALVSIAGPLLDATDTAITALFNLVFVSRSTLIGTDSDPLVTLTNTADRAYPFGGNDPVSGALGLGGFLHVNGTTGGSNAPTNVTLAGPLLHTTNTGGQTTFTTTADFIGVVNAAQVTTTTAEPLITSDHSTFTVGSLANRRSFVGVGGTGGATGVELARLNLRGPLLRATDDILDISGNILTLFRSGALIDTAAPSGEALLRFSNSTVTSTTAAIASVTGFNGGTSTLTLARPLLSATDTTITAATGLFRLFDGAQATSTATSPFVQVSGDTVTTGAAGPGTGGVFRMQSAVGQNPTSFTIADGFLVATDGAVLTAEGQNGFVTVRNAAVLTSTGATPFLDFHGASASAGQDMMVIGPFVAPGAVPPTVTLAGPLFRARDTGSPITFSTGTGPITGIFLNINDGAVVTKTGSLPLIELIGTGADRVVLALSREIFFLSTVALGQPAPTTLTFAGPLLSAVNARIAVGNPAVGSAFTSFRLGGDAILTKTDATPLIDLVSTNLVSAGRVLELAQFLGPTQAGPVLSLGAAPLLRATGSSISTSSTGVGFACCSGFELRSAAQLTATGTAPLIQLTNTTFSAGGDNVSGQHFFDLADLGGGAPATMTIGGPLLSAVDSTVTALGSGLQVFQSNLTGTATATAALMQFTSTVDRTISFGGTNPLTLGESLGNFLRVVASASDPFNASVTLHGPLLSTTNTGVGTRTTFDTKGDFIAVLTGARLLSNTAAPFVSSTNSIFNVGVPAGGRFLLVSGTGGEFGEGPEGARAVFSGPLLASTNDGFIVKESFVEANDSAAVFAAGLTPFLQFTGSTLNAKSFASLRTGGQILLDAPLATVDAAGALPSILATLVAVESSGSNVSQLTTSFIEPLVQFSGTPTGPHLLAPDASPFRAMFDIRGLDFDVAFDPDQADPDVPVFTLGTLTPIQHASELFRGDNGTQAQTKQLVSLDTALFEASKPLMNLRNGTSLTSTNDLINLLQKAHLSATLVPGDALVTLNASTLTINNGSLLNLTGGSFARVTGDLVRLDNTSTLNIANGNLITISNGSMLKLTSGSLGRFGVTGANTINITNTATCSCTPVALPNFAGVGVLLRNGALPSNVIVDPTFVPFANLGGSNTVNISGASGAVIMLDGSTSKVKLGP